MTRMTTLPIIVAFCLITAATALLLLRAKIPDTLAVKCDPAPEATLTCSVDSGAPAEWYHDHALRKEGDAVTIIAKTCGPICLPWHNKQHMPKEISVPLEDNVRSVGYMTTSGFKELWHK